ncbi:undecaprenyl-diphosphate phosphatase [Rossellomorea vietnamensis]|uniref:Undecaprenyl-diphosphatase n=2 Tax=Rossellomorea TaxID=2837508 RepID=A0A5D4KKJ1_9BACI|nr:MULTISPECIES: undecaprenyl-diphosphate phosphatase [Rossellomorea]TYR77811.1 undecaprenyl-diphosphate phosphatase [Rossellomorea vietnamensis]TYS83359.1 undecaprenyl-diphosphate phosphatase [Rossellomorea aquimaris]
MTETAYELLKYLFLGLFQGFTEPIPISSSGHLQLAQHYLGIDLPGLTFELLVNTASLFAVLIIYRGDILRLIVNGLGYFKEKTPENKRDFHFIIYLIIGTIPAGVIGVLFGDFISEELSGIKTVAITLIITGFALWLIRNLRGRKHDGDLTFKDAIIVGLAQAVALIPGISRSGATIVAAMARGMNQETALRYSFLLFIPVSFGGMLLGLSDLLADENLTERAIPYAVAFLGSLVASYFSLKWFMNIMAKGNLKIFAIYCVIVGAAVLIF